METDHPQTGSVLKELSDIKASLAVNTAETQNIKGSIAELKVDIKSLVAGTVSTNDFDVHLKADADHETRIRDIESFKQNLIGKMWGIGIMAGVVMSAISLVINHYWKG